MRPERRKKLSAGVIVTDGDSVLLGHVTGSRHWDIPKGGLDPGENELAAAIRELHEETSMLVDPDRLEQLGTFVYKKTKDLSLWLCRVETMPDPGDLDCLSTFDAGNGVRRKEMDGFGVFDWNRAYQLVVPDMTRVLAEVRNRISAS